MKWYVPLLLLAVLAGCRSLTEGSAVDTLSVAELPEDIVLAQPVVKIDPSLIVEPIHPYVMDSNDGIHGTIVLFSKPVYVELDQGGYVRTEDYFDAEVTPFGLKVTTLEGDAYVFNFTDERKKEVSKQILTSKTKLDSGIILEKSMAPTHMYYTLEFNQSPESLLIQPPKECVIGSEAIKCGKLSFDFEMAKDVQNLTFKTDSRGLLIENFKGEKILDPYITIDANTNQSLIRVWGGYYIGGFPTPTDPTSGLPYNQITQGVTALTTASALDYRDDVTQRSVGFASYSTGFLFAGKIPTLPAGYIVDSYEFHTAIERILNAVPILKLRAYNAVSDSYYQCSAQSPGISAIVYTGCEGLDSNYVNSSGWVQVLAYSLGGNSGETSADYFNFAVNYHLSLNTTITYPLSDNVLTTSNGTKNTVYARITSGDKVLTSTPLIESLSVGGTKLNVTGDYTYGSGVFQLQNGYTADESTSVVLLNSTMSGADYTVLMSYDDEVDMVWSQIHDYKYVSGFRIVKEDDTGSAESANTIWTAISHGFYQAGTGQRFGCGYNSTEVATGTFNVNLPVTMTNNSYTMFCTGYGDSDSPTCVNGSKTQTSHVMMFVDDAGGAEDMDVDMGEYCVFDQGRYSYGGVDIFSGRAVTQANGTMSISFAKPMISTDYGVFTQSGYSANACVCEINARRTDGFTTYCQTDDDADCNAQSMDYVVIDNNGDFYGRLDYADQEISYKGNGNWSINLTMPAKNDGTYDFIINLTYATTFSNATSPQSITYGAGGEPFSYNCHITADTAQTTPLYCPNGLNITGAVLLGLTSDLDAKGKIAITNNGKLAITGAGIVNLTA